jgi:hypothetical protein
MPIHERRCPHCRKPHFRRQAYCSRRCYHRAWRRRRAGLPEDFANGQRGARRGRRSLTQAAAQLKLRRMQEELEAARIEAERKSAAYIKERFGRRR